MSGREEGELLKSGAHLLQQEGLSSKKVAPNLGDLPPNPQETALQSTGGPNLPSHPPPQGSDYISCDVFTGSQQPAVPKLDFDAASMAEGLEFLSSLSFNSGESGYIQ